MIEIQKMAAADWPEDAKIYQAGMDTNLVSVNFHEKYGLRLARPLQHLAGGGI